MFPSLPRINGNSADDEGVDKKQVANPPNVNVQTVWRITKLEVKTGSVFWGPVVKELRPALNGIDCTVCFAYCIHHDTRVLSGC